MALRFGVGFGWFGLVSRWKDGITMYNSSEVFWWFFGSKFGLVWVVGFSVFEDDGVALSSFFSWFLKCFIYLEDGTLAALAALGPNSAEDISTIPSGVCKGVLWMDVFAFTQPTN